MRRLQSDALPFLVPAALLLAAVTAVPMLDVAWMSLQARTPFRAPAFAGIDNFGRLVADARFWNAAWNTVYFAAVSVALEIALGLVVALAVVRAERLRALVYGAILVPWAIPGVVSARMWEWIYNPEIGLVNRVLGVRINWLGDPTLALHAAIAMDVWKSTPFVALLLVAGLQGIPRDLYRAAAVDGAGPWATFARVTLPMLLPVVLVAAVFRTIDALRVFDAIYVLTGGGPANGTETLSIYAYKVLFQTLDFGYGAALSVAVLALTALVTLGYAKLLKGGGA